MEFVGPSEVGSMDAAHSTILVVEDETILRWDAAECLRECGFEVLEAGNAEIDLVLTDVQMQGPDDGFEIALWSKHHRHGTKVLLTSGRPHELPSALVSLGPIMAKPYDLRLLVERIRHLLPRHSPMKHTNAERNHR
jgi:DNA-binding response OmpR family regulator